MYFSIIWYFLCMCLWDFICILNCSEITWVHTIVSNLTYFIILGYVLLSWDIIYSGCGGNSSGPWVTTGSIVIYLTCRYKLGSPSFKGGSAEISVEFWWSFPEAGPILGTVLSYTLGGFSFSKYQMILVMNYRGVTVVFSCLSSFVFSPNK